MLSAPLPPVKFFVLVLDRPRAMTVGLLMSGCGLNHRSAQEGCKECVAEGNWEYGTFKGSASLM